MNVCQVCGTRYETGGHSAAPCPKCPTLTDSEKLNLLIKECETIIPYVTATLGHGNTFDSADPRRNGEWVEVHKGRAGSSERQLDWLLKVARRFSK